MEVPRPDKVAIGLFRLLPRWIRYPFYICVLLVLGLYPDAVAQLLTSTFAWSVILTVVLLPHVISAGLTGIGIMGHLNRFGMVSLPWWFEPVRLVTLPFRVVTGAISLAETVLELLFR